MVQLVAVVLVLLQPQRVYFQPDQPIPVAIDTALFAQSAAPGETKLALLSPTGKLRLMVPFDASAESVDLNKIFPGEDGIWDGRVHYVQALSGGEPIGSPLVVVPLLQPHRARVRDPDALRIEVEHNAVLHTDQGDITIRLLPQYAPNTADHFATLVERGFYTHIPFHRILPGFVIQGGDPTGTGQGGPGYQIDLEPSPAQHSKGIVSMARQGHDVNTGGSQFFICLSRDQCRGLDGQYAVFGEVVDGLDAVDKIAAVELADPTAGRPAEPPRILSAELIPAPPRAIDDSQ